MLSFFLQENSDMLGGVGTDVALLTKELKRRLASKLTM